MLSNWGCLRIQLLPIIPKMDDIQKCVTVPGSTDRTHFQFEEKFSDWWPAEYT